MKTPFKILLLAALPLFYGCNPEYVVNSNDVSRERVSEDLKFSGARLLLQPETIDYETRIISVGGEIDEATLAEVDKFIVSTKNSGVFEKLEEVCLFAGSNLNASLVKLVAGSNSPALLKNNNFVEEDYSQSTGFGPSEDVNKKKFLESGFIPASAGIDYTNGSVGLFLVGGRTRSDDGTGILGTNPATPPAQEGYCYLGGYYLGSGNYNPPLPKSGFRMMSLGWHSNEAVYFIESIQHGYKPVIPIGLPFNSPYILFRPDRYKQTLFSKGKIGGYYVGRGLTTQQQSELDLALMNFNKALGRYPEGEIDVWIGDSVTSGVGNNIDPRGTNIFPYLVSEAFGRVCINAGTPSGQLCVNTVFGGGAQLAAFQKVEQTVNLNPSRVFITIGENDCNMSDPTVNGDANKVAIYKATLIAMIDELKNAGVPEVIVNSLPYFTKASNAKRNLYIRAQQQAAEATDVQFIDIHSPTLNNADAFHLTGRGHGLAANAIINALQ